MKPEEIRLIVGCTPRQCDRTKVEGECFCEWAARFAPEDVTKEELRRKFLMAAFRWESYEGGQNEDQH